MSREIQLIYNELVADEKLKGGTEYERLAAIVFKILAREDSVVHDVELRGDGKETPHQIDVRVRRDSETLRWIIECRDFAADSRRPKIGLGEVRDFASVVRDLKPDRSMMLTTVGFTSVAEKYAGEQRIELGLLRGFTDADWEGRVREIRYTGTFSAPSDLKITAWKASDDAERQRVQPLLQAQGNLGEEQVLSGEEEQFFDADGQAEATFSDVLEPIYKGIQQTLEPGINTGTVALGRIRHVRLGEVLVAVRGFDWEVERFDWTHSWTQTLGEGIARMVLKTRDDSIDRAIFDREIVAWEFDADGEVRPRSKD